MSKLMEQAKAMQENMQKMQAEIAAMEVEGTAGAGLVKTIMNGRHDVKKISIDPSLLADNDKEMLEDLIAAAINDAVRKIESESKGKMSDLMPGMPKDFKMPF